MTAAEKRELAAALQAEVRLAAATVTKRMDPEMARLLDRMADRLLEQVQDSPLPAGLPALRLRLEEGALKMEVVELLDLEKPTATTATTPAQEA